MDGDQARVLALLGGERQREPHDHCHGEAHQREGTDDPRAA
jgi:hypothetical protein